MVAQVIVDISNSEVDKVFEYNIPEGMALSEGYRVKVPFGKRTIMGYVLSVSEEKNTEHELKDIFEVIDDMAVINREQICLAEYMKKHYHLRKIDVLNTFLPAKLKSGPQIKVFCKLKDGINISELKIKSNAKNQLKLLNDLLQVGKMSQTEINSKYGNSTLKALKNMGIIEEEQVRNYRSPEISEIKKKDITLTPDQDRAIKTILSDNKVKVLFGVTGSGKTEVYMQAIRKVLEQGKTAIMLVPEISLTPQTMANFKAEFGNNIALIHSALSVGERFDEWDRIISKDVKIVVGVRSAIFVPLENIGLIIIDEEHDTSYYSESNPRYYTHEIANFRAKYNSCPLVLGSATPSVDSMLKVKNGEYVLVEMMKRINNNPLPEIHIVDMVNEMREGNTSKVFSREFLRELKKTIRDKKQGMILLNRRGYQSTVRCIDCGYVAKCEKCDVSLVYHKEDNCLMCHYCGMKYKVLTECPQCHKESLRFGAIGTEKIVDELNKLFPGLPVFRMDNDSVKGKNGHHKILDSFKKTSPSILVGTQMIAKGHDYPLVRFVGIVDADASLHFADYRAAENTFSLLTQVAGRAGRADVGGVVVLQTYAPKSKLYEEIVDYDYKRFYEYELMIRERTMFPPFTRIVRIMVTSLNDASACALAEKIYIKSKAMQKEFAQEDIIYLDCMRSPLKKIDSKYRVQILFRIKNNQNEIMDRIFEIVDSEKDKNCTVFVEINPQSLQ